MRSQLPPLDLLVAFEAAARLLSFTAAAGELHLSQAAISQQIRKLETALGAALFGVLSGVGLLSLFRHGATLGGVGIVALMLQDKKAIPAGTTQLAFDLCVFVLAFFLFPWPVVVWSIFGAVILNGIITINHRRDRYIAQ